MRPQLPVRLFHTLSAALIFMSLSAGGSLAATEAPSPEAAEAYIDTMANEALAILKDESLTTAERKSKLSGLMKQEVQLDYIGKLALGRYNRAPANLSPVQQEEFKAKIQEYRALFPDFAFEKMYNLVLDDLNNSTLEVISATQIRKTDTMVNTKITRPGKESIVADWRVRANSDGDLKIVDVVAEGISLTVTQRDDFSTTAAEGGIDKVITSMRQILPAEAAETVGEPDSIPGSTN